MTSRMKDFTGMKFGLLTVIELDRIDEKKNTRWLCLCECGNTKSIRGFQLTAGTKSCGCLQRKAASKSSKTHGKSKSREYDVWAAMLQRCINPQNPAYKNYGGRGISVCDEWHSFSNFIEDMGARPSEKHSLDRVENNLGYSKSNCRWATKAEQMRNTRRNKQVQTPLGMMLVCDAVIAFGIKAETIRGRIRRGLTADAVFEPVQSKGA